MTLEGTPQIVSQQGVAGLTFADEAETANRYARDLRAPGRRDDRRAAARGRRPGRAGGINDCIGFTGPIVDIANRMDPSIDVIVSGHTHQAYNCKINGKLVTSASSFGRLVTDIDLKIDRRTGDVLTAKANNVVVTRDVAEGPGADRADQPVQDRARPGRRQGGRRDHQRDHQDAGEPVPDRRRRQRQAGYQR